MPEGDAVWRTARRLHDAFAGEVLTDWDARWARWATTDLRGATTLEVVPRGKHLLHRLDSGHTLHTHLRMEGSWSVRPKSGTRPGALRAPDIRLLLGTAETWGIGRRLGLVEIVPTAEEARVVGHLGPDPLGADWSVPQVVAGLRAGSGRPVGAALMDQRLLAGLGTIWASETLYAERVAPLADVGALPDAVLSGLGERAARLLRAATTGRPALAVYGRRGRPCPRCGTPITVLRVGVPPQDRQLFLCPRCQADAG